MDYTLIIESNGATMNQLLSCVGSFSALLEEPQRSIYILNPYQQEYKICLDTFEFYANDVLKVNYFLPSRTIKSLINNLQIRTSYVWHVYGNSLVTDENSPKRIFDFLEKNRNINNLRIQSSRFYRLSSETETDFVPQELQDIIRRL